MRMFGYGLRKGRVVLCYELVVLQFAGRDAMHHCENSDPLLCCCMRTISVRRRAASGHVKNTQKRVVCLHYDPLPLHVVRGC